MGVAWDTCLAIFKNKFRITRGHAVCNKANMTQCYSRILLFFIKLIDLATDRHRRCGISPGVAGLVLVSTGIDEWARLCLLESGSAKGAACGKRPEVLLIIYAWNSAKG